MKRNVQLGLGWLGTLGLVWVGGCGPGPLPPENPPQNLAQAPEAVPVQVESTAAEAPKAEEPAPAPEPEKIPHVAVAADRGLLTPESVYYDAASDKYFVSNINGSPSAADNNGFVSIVNPDGSVEKLDFIAGGKNGVTLNAPKGLTVHDGTLFVADISFVRKFDAKTGAPKGAIAFPKATFINDVVAAANGTLYVSDTGIKIDGNGPTPTGTDAIYKVVGGKVSVLAKGEQLHKPNGVGLVGDTVVTGTFGANQLLQLDAKGAVVSTTALPGASIDGVVVLANGQLLASSWEKQSVYIGSLGGEFTVLRDQLPSPADIGFDTTRSRVLVPLFLSNELRFVPVAIAPAAAAPTTAAPTTAAPAAAAPSAPTATPVAVPAPAAATPPANK